jgi:hypothetical protein
MKRREPAGSVENDPSRTSVHLSVAANGFIAERPQGPGSGEHEDFSPAP